jgi:Fe-Mn family superoxide dismutase
VNFDLSPLPYPKEALEPALSARTLQFHYEKHHRGYMNKLEKALSGKPLAQKSLEEIICSVEGSLFNHAAQVWNHDFYWRSMTPNGGGRPSGELAAAIERDFGSLADWKQRFAEAANDEFGSGWAWLVAGPEGRLRVISTSDAENPIRSGSRPLLTLDVWEHAYYLDYQNERDRYVRGYLDSLVNWTSAEKNFESDGSLR